MNPFDPEQERIAYILHEVRALRAEVHGLAHLITSSETRIMSTLADLKTALDQQGDFLTALAARIGAITPADPSQQAEIDAMVSELTDHNTTIQNLAPAATAPVDASGNPA